MRPRAFLLTLLLTAAPKVVAAAVTLGAEFQVNTYTLTKQSEPVSAMDADGDFVVVWKSELQTRRWQ